MKTVIHINQHVIKKNKKSGIKECPITCKNRICNEKSSEVAILGPSKVVYRPDKPLKCGAVCWVETNSDIDASLNAKFKSNHAPDIQANFYFDGIGYQLDILANGKHYGTECRDFGGETKPSKLRTRTVELLEELVKTLREEN